MSESRAVDRGNCAGFRSGSVSHSEPDHGIVCPTPPPAVDQRGTTVAGGRVPASPPPSDTPPPPPDRPITGHGEWTCIVPVALLSPLFPPVPARPVTVGSQVRGRRAPNGHVVYGMRVCGGVGAGRCWVMGMCGGRSEGGR